MKKDSAMIKKKMIHFWNEERSLTALLILLIVEMFVIVPTTRIGSVFIFVGTFVFSLLLLAGLLAMARHKVLQVIAGAFVICTISVRLARIVFNRSDLLLWDVFLSMLSIVGMVIVVIWQVYREGPVTSHRVRGAIAAYLLLANLFAYSYIFIFHLAPGAFQLSSGGTLVGAEITEAFLYFSMVALTTVGFGDITAVHPFARSLVMLEALIGQLYPVVLIARLVALEMESRSSDKGGSQADIQK
jgi:hypothetical protein